jgi:hypothetical protein
MRPPFLPPTRPLRLRARPARGAALLVALVVAVLALSSCLMSDRFLQSAGIGNNQERDEQDRVTLVAASHAVRAYFIRTGTVRATVGGATLGKSLGYLPQPDALHQANGQDPAEPNYDGIREQGCTSPGWAPGDALIDVGVGPNPPPMRCIGRLPWRSLGLDLTGLDRSPNAAQNDASGRLPFLAVAAALTTPNCPELVDKRILGATYAAWPGGCNTAWLDQTAIGFPWLSVFDARGNLLTNRAAFVLIMPGLPVANQSRPSTPIGNTAQYLEGFQMAAGACPAKPTGWPPAFWPGCSFNNAQVPPNNAAGNRLGMAFVQCPPQGTVNPSDTSYIHPVQCNDKVTYMTIDELVKYAQDRGIIDP